MGNAFGAGPNNEAPHGRDVTVEDRKSERSHTCTTDVKQWYMRNGLQLNPDKSEVLHMGTANQLQAVSSLTSVSVAGVDLPI